MMKNNNEEKFIQGLEEDLENLERYIQEYSLFLPLAVYIINPSGIIVDVNKAGAELSKYEESDLIGKDIDFLFKNKKRIKNYFDNSSLKGSIENKDLELLTKSKKEIPVKISLAVRRDQPNNNIGCFLAVSDITKVKRFQEKLQNKVKQRTRQLEETKNKLTLTLKETREAKKIVEDEKNKTSSIISNLVDPIIILDKNGKLSMYNFRAEQILGFRRKDIGTSINNKKNYSLENFKEFLKVDFTVKSGDELHSKYSNEEQINIKYNDEDLTFKIITAEIYDNRKRFIGTMKVFSDLTREARINRLKTEFVSIAAHQLRTPLSAIKWSIKMILDEDMGPINAEQRDMLDKGFKSNERIIKLVNDLLNVSRIEEGKFGYDFKKENFLEICENVISNITNKLQKKNINFVFSKPEKLLPVMIDKEKVGLVLQNLVENAVKYTAENGRVSLILQEKGNTLFVKIMDNGVGIPKKDQKKLFTKFFRAENVMKMQTDGTGLGLFIAKNVINKHHGKIGFKSEEGKGSEFYFTLPIYQDKKD